MDFKKYDEPPVKHMISMIYEDEIERLNVKIERLREALQEIAKSQPSECEQAFNFKMIARAALKEKE